MVCSPRSKRIKYVLDTRQLSFPLQNNLGVNEPITEGNENNEESQKRTLPSSKSLENLQRQYQLDRELKELEENLMRYYEKWDLDKRKNHENAIALYAQFNRQTQSCHI